jgi:hypothetical protein
VGGVGAIVAMVWVAMNGHRERDSEDAARAYFDHHGHWPDEEPGPTAGRGS